MKARKEPIVNLLVRRHEAVRALCERQTHFPFFLLRDAHSSFLFYMASRKTDKSLLLSATLGSKDKVALMRLFFPDFYLDIEVKDIVEDVNRSQYSVSLYVADDKATKSTKSKPRSSVVKWEWKANNQL